MCKILTKLQYSHFVKIAERVLNSCQLASALVDPCAGDRIIQPGTELILAETGPLAGRYILVQPLGFGDVRAKVLDQKSSVYTMRFLSYQIVQTLAFAHAK